ncbi:BA14K family protein [Mesorhizobium sp. CN2-181]|uniref:BA14K family protein n=1 Tax=Mesorhizobium yinganensis TaxID=3157707 RepID=UPI0032B76A14
MKLFLAGLSGFVLTLAIFATGAIFAIYLTTAEPVPDWELNNGSRWAVETTPAYAEPSKRLPARPSTPAAVVGKNLESPPVDMTVTGAVPDQTSETPAEPEPAEAMDMAHLQWCNDHYRSYRPQDNSYRSYSGRRKECVSPFNAGSSSPDDKSFDAAEPTLDETYLGYAVTEDEPTAYTNSRHIASCFARYRSYNPEDNSYQPYGRRSRRQCE